MAMKIYPGLPGSEEYSKRRKEAVGEVLTNALLMLVAPQAMAGKALARFPRFSSTEEALAFGRTAGKQSIPMLKRAMKAAEVRSNRSFGLYSETGIDKYANEAIQHGTQRQLYREALEVLLGEMP